jgi:hypothetical protein
MYRGYFKDGVKCGLGRMTATGESYNGRWKADRPNG